MVAPYFCYRLMRSWLSSKKKGTGAVPLPLLLDKFLSFLSGNHTELVAEVQLD